MRIKSSFILIHKMMFYYYDEVPLGRESIRPYCCVTRCAAHVFFRQGGYFDSVLQIRYNFLLHCRSMAEAHPEVRIVSASTRSNSGEDRDLV